MFLPPRLPRAARFPPFQVRPGVCRIHHPTRQVLYVDTLKGDTMDTDNVYSLPLCQLCGMVYGRERDLMADYVSHENRGEGGSRDGHTCASCTETLRRAESIAKHPSNRGLTD